MSAGRGGGLTAGIWVTSIITVLALAFSGAVLFLGVELPWLKPTAQIRLQAATGGAANAFTGSFAATDASLISGIDSEEGEVSADAVPAGSIDGGAAGVYAGVLGQSSCDVAGLQSALTADAAKAAAWAQAFAGEAALWDNSALTADGIVEFLAWLTPVLTTSDLWVTSTGYADGEGSAEQVVLQAGSAVLVDMNGVPRVDCGTGDPLTAAEAPEADGALVYTGPVWSTFSPGGVSKVSGSAQTVLAFALTDPSGSTFQRVARTAGVFDTSDYGTDTVFQAGEVKLVFEGKGQAITADLGKEAGYVVAAADSAYAGGLDFDYYSSTGSFPDGTLDGISFGDYNFGGASIDAITRLKGLTASGECAYQELGDVTFGAYTGYARSLEPCTDGDGWNSLYTHYRINLSGDALELYGNAYVPEPEAGGTLATLGALITALLTYDRL